MSANDDDAGGGPQIQVDSDWKAQARAEKEKLAQKPEAGGGAKPDAASGGATSGGRSGGGFGGEVPPANFETLISSFVTQALFAMGAIPDPQTGQPVMQLDLARYQIDLLAVLEDKCKGNLSEEEQKMLASTLYELRSRYVQVANAARSPGS
ncbi:MAG: DUF1844 domain-containing protein [Planctomycetota bacterium]